MRGCDVNLHVARAGVPGGTPVILLHGFPENWSSWRHQIGPLADAGFDVYALDMRGYNLSDRPPHRDDYRMRLLIDDVAEIVRATKQRSACIVGHDWGGIVAWTFAGAYPELITKLVIMNAPHLHLFRKLVRSRRSIQIFRSWYVALFQIPGLAEKLLSANNHRALRRLFSHGAARPGAFSNDDIDAYVDAAAQPGALTAMLNYYRAAREPGSIAIARASRVECDTLVIWGDRDRALSVRLLDDIEDVAPLVTVRRIPDAGHWVQNEAPATVTRWLLDFLAEPPSQAGRSHLRP
jgi:pimeloyl-ACP methyl ester carboxylesterase